MIDSPPPVVSAPSPPDALPAARRRHRGRDEWIELIDAQSRSGLAVAEFCRQHDLGLASFYAWRRQLASHQAPPEAPSPTPHFVRLQPTTPGHDDARPVAAHFPNGVRLMLDESALPALVAALCEAGFSC